MKKTINRYFLLLFAFVASLFSCAIPDTLDSTEETQSSKMDISSFAVGINMPWNNFGYDFGDSFNYSAFMQAFKKYSEAGINAVRVWVHPDGRGGLTFAADGSVSGIKSGFTADFVQMLKLAKDYSLYILPSLWSFDMVKDYSTVGGGLHGDIIKDQSKTQSYINNALIPLLNAVKASAYSDRIFAWEICNEPEWIPQEDTSVTKADVQRFHAMIAAAIHNNDSRWKVTTGSASLKWNSDLHGAEGNWWSDSQLKAAHPAGSVMATLDIYQIHFYDWMIGATWRYTPYDSGYTPSYWGIADKPVIIGETPGQTVSNSYFSLTVEEAYRKAYSHGYKGVFAWSDKANDGHGNWSSISAAIKSFLSDF